MGLAQQARAAGGAAIRLCRRDDCIKAVIAYGTLMARALRPLILAETFPQVELTGNSGRLA